MALCGLLAACGTTGSGPAGPDPSDPAATTRFRLGAAGAGDRYFPLDGNGGYDVARYGLDLAYDPPSDRLTGTATITARATLDLSRFDLDLEGLDVRSVEVDGRRATWSRRDQELVITPASGLRRGAEFTVAVRYGGVPETLDEQFGTTGFIATDDGAYVIGEPHAAKTWFPVNDHPSDRASYRFRVTVPAGLEVVANGRLVGTERGGGSTTWTWEAEPMASYLATTVIGQLDLRTYEEDGIAYVDALDPDLLDRSGGSPSLGGQAERALAKQPDIIAFLAERFGPYPFGSAGGIVDDAEFSFSLETQTRPIYSMAVFSDPRAAEQIVVHELAHQWFGDSLVLRSWDHIWLNEGFATYAQWMWGEAEGLGTAQQQFDMQYATPASDDFWDLRIGDPGSDHLFDEPVYQRGAMTLHQLRRLVGERDFSRILRRWATTKAGGLVTTSAFVRVAEDVSGRQLDDLFDAWLFTAGRPDRVP